MPYAIPDDLADALADEPLLEDDDGELTVPLGADQAARVVEALSGFVQPKFLDRRKVIERLVKGEPDILDAGRQPTLREGLAIGGRFNELVTEQEPDES